MNRQALETLAQQKGIACRYIDAQGQPQRVADDTLLALLAAIEPSDIVQPQPIPRVLVLPQASPYLIPCAQIDDYRWSVTLEGHSGRTAYQGDIRQGNHLTLTHSLPLGYHRLTVIQGEHTYHCQLIIAPARCYEPEALLKGEKLWGACIQLYTLRSATNWGIGDFSDLKHLIGEIAQRGGSFIGLNPIHALYPALPENASPYSPSSRRWLNIAYIDVNQVPEFQHSVTAQRWWQSQATQQELQRLRTRQYVDYTGVITLKLTALRQAFCHFQENPSRDNDAFNDFVAAGGKSLHQQAVFDTLQQQVVSDNPSAAGWQDWPAYLQTPDSQEVQEFCASHCQEIHFHLWLQWLAHQQLQSCCAETQRLGMAIGLYRDLAVGVAKGGAETWGERSYYALQASVGAPPDALGPLGQDWQLPPTSPQTMIQRGYEPFITLLRANMASCGALRIDHVMALLRLWWIPQGQSARQGAYVYYPLDDLLAILALESQRNRCMIIGEDLGIVPPEIVGKLKASAVYSYKVMYFEQHSTPQDYPFQAMATITTHDLPTLAGYWQEDDLQRGAALNLYPDPAQLAKLIEEREQSKQHWLEALQQHEGYICDPEDRQKMSSSLSYRLQSYFADNGCALVGSLPEDWLLMTDPVNIPGTTDAYPNWRRKLSVPIETIFASPEINRLLDVIHRRRVTSTKL